MNPDGGGKSRWVSKACKSAVRLECGSGYGAIPPAARRAAGSRPLRRMPSLRDSVKGPGALDPKLDATREGRAPDPWDHGSNLGFRLRLQVHGRARLAAG